MEARVAASAGLQALLERQRRALGAAQIVAAEDVPPALRDAIAARRARRLARLLRRLALAPALAAATVVVAAVAMSGGPGAPTVAEAARLATEVPPAPVPPPATGPAGTRLALGIEGVAFPDLRSYGWRAVGVRRGRVDGRALTVVFYGNGGRRLGYLIVGGNVLARPTGGSARYETLRVNGRLAVTWRRGGHTCVLLGQATRPELLSLAHWPPSR